MSTWTGILHTVSLEKNGKREIASGIAGFAEAGRIKDGKGIAATEGKRKLLRLKFLGKY